VKSARWLLILLFGLTRGRVFSASRLRKERVRLAPTHESGGLAPFVYLQFRNLTGHITASYDAPESGLGEQTLQSLVIVTVLVRMDVIDGRTGSDISQEML
jgi:hypothetical protein